MAEFKDRVFDCGLTSVTRIDWPAPERHATLERLARGDGRAATVRWPVSAEGVVHVWAASLDVPASALSAFESTLSEVERDRAARFRFEEHRGRYIAGRGWLRRLLSSYLQISAGAIEFEQSVKGKPALAGAAAKNTGLQFNVAHSGGLLLVAVALGARVGVDVELVRSLPDTEELAARFFSKRENVQFQSLPDEQKPMAFFRLWTRKEAWLKATGEGIAHLLDQVEVSFATEESARLLHLPDAFRAKPNWSLTHLAPGPGYIGALAVESKQAEVKCWRVELETFAVQ